MAIDTEGFGEDGVALLQVASDCFHRPVLIDLLVLERAHPRDEIGKRIDSMLSSSALKLVHDCHDDAHLLTAQFGALAIQNVIDVQLVYESAQPDSPWIGFAALLAKYMPSFVHATKADMKRQFQRGSDCFRTRPLASKAKEYAADDVGLLLKAWLEGDFDLVADELDMLSKASALRWAFAASGTTGRRIAFDDEHRLRSHEIIHQASEAASESDYGVVLRINTDTDRLFEMLPEPITDRLMGESLFSLRDVVFDTGRPPRAFFVEGTGTRSVVLGTSALDKSTIQGIANKMSFGPDNRAGLDGSLHRISAMRNLNDEVYGLTMRIGRSVSGSVERIHDLLLGRSCGSILVLGAPGSGKTTVVRDAAATLSAHGTAVVIVDTSNEIAGDGDVPHASVGLARRMMVPDLAAQARVMIECVQNHTPDVMIIDEIGRAQEVAAASTVKQRGVRLVASAHGDLRSLVKNAQLRGLVGGVETVTLGDEAAKQNGGSKTKAQRAGPPVFDTVVELRVGEFNSWQIVHDVGNAVDCILDGKQFKCQRRIRDADECMRLVFETA
jgi:stage III sporulation protein SpoIIIAA